LPWPASSAGVSPPEYRVDACFEAFEYRTIVRYSTIIPPWDLRVNQVRIVSEAAARRRGTR
jgi:hypothetical protein